MDTKKLQQVLEGKCTLPESLKVLKFPQEAIDRIMSEISEMDKHDTSVLALNALMCKRVAYGELVGRGVIDGEEMFSLMTNDLAKNSERHHTEIGVNSKGMFRWVKGEWEACA